MLRQRSGASVRHLNRESHRSYFGIVTIVTIKQSSSFDYAGMATNHSQAPPQAHTFRAGLLAVFVVSLALTPRQSHSGRHEDSKPKYKQLWRRWLVERQSNSILFRIGSREGIQKRSFAATKSSRR